MDEQKQMEKALVELCGVDSIDDLQGTELRFSRKVTEGMFAAGYAAALNDGWTYCEDRLPEAEEGGYYFATRKTESGRVYTWQTHFSPELQSWSVTGNEHVIAWRRKPEPAKGRDV